MKPQKKVAAKEEKLSVKERLARKKAEAEEKETPKKKKAVVKEEPKKSKKKVAEVIGRGRPKGVKYVLTDKYQESLEEEYSSFSSEYKNFENALTKFIENGNKSAAKKARESIMGLQKKIKGFRKLIQEAKENGLQAEAV